MKAARKRSNSKISKLFNSNQYKEQLISFKIHLRYNCFVHLRHVFSSEFSNPNSRLRKMNYGGKFSQCSYTIIDNFKIVIN